jgi:hypothetical protein
MDKLLELEAAFPVELIDENDFVMLEENDETICAPLFILINELDLEISHNFRVKNYLRFTITARSETNFLIFPVHYYIENIMYNCSKNDIVI